MKVETKVGLLFLVAIGLVAAFAHYLGMLNFFSQTKNLYVTYNFAGGIEVGSPVRVMGIKVGKVREILFDPNMKDTNGNEVKLKIGISIENQAWTTLRNDSQFFINLAGVIGEKYIEVSPGSLSAPSLKNGDILRGIDPPRIDQLLSQSYGLAGKVLEFLNKNEGPVSNILDTTGRLVVSLERVLKQVDKTSRNKDIAQLVDNLIQISGDLAAITKRFRGPDADKTIDLLYRLVWRLEELDAKTIKKVLQEEGIRARIF